MSSKIVFDVDDLCDDFDPWAELMAWKEKVPQLKVTLFAIPSRCSEGLLEKYRALDWVEIGTHGYHHAPRECAVWGEEEAESKLEELEELGWKKVFKAPNWQISPPLYEALVRRGWKVADHAAYAWTSMDLPVDRYTFNLPGCEFESVHGHTWECDWGGPKDWDLPQDGEYLFVSEACRVLPWGYKDLGTEQEDSSWSHESVWGKNSWQNFQDCFAEVPIDETIGDFGGNDGTNARLAKKDGRDVTVIEGLPMKAAYADTKSFVKTVCANLESLPIPDRAFDWGYCSHTLEHIPDIEAAWEEIKRCCRKGCYVVLPVESQEFFDEHSPSHFHRADHDGWCELLGMEPLITRPNELVARWVR